MRYQVEMCPNPQMIVIHLDVRIPDIHVDDVDLCSDGLDDEDRVLVQSIMDVDGVERVYGGRYDVSIGKGKLFDWEAILPQVVEILRLRFTPKAPAVLVKQQ